MGAVHKHIPNIALGTLKKIVPGIKTLYPEYSVSHNASERISEAHFFHTALGNNKPFLCAVKSGKGKGNKKGKRSICTSVIGHRVLSVSRKNIYHKRKINIKEGGSIAVNN